MSVESGPTRPVYLSWCLTTTYSHHYTNDKGWFSTFEDCGPIEATSASGDAGLSLPVIARGRGEVKLLVKTQEGIQFPLDLKEVRYIPSAAESALSLSRLTASKLGYAAVHPHKMHFRFRHGEGVLNVVGPRIVHRYYLRVEDTRSDKETALFMRQFPTIPGGGIINAGANGAEEAVQTAKSRAVPHLEPPLPISPGYQHPDLPIATTENSTAEAAREDDDQPTETDTLRRSTRLTEKGLKNDP